MTVLSKNRIAKMMVEKLIEFPVGTKKLKENVTYRLGMIGFLSSTRDVNAAWDEAKKKAAKLHPDKFILDDRGVLHWNDGQVKILDKNITAANFKKLNALAETEGCNVNSMVSKLISFYKKSQKK